MLILGGRDSSWFLQSPHKFTGKPHPHWNPLCGGESSRWPGPCTPSTPKEMSQKGSGDVRMWICCCSWFYVGVCVLILNYCNWKSRIVAAVAVVCHAGWWVQPVKKMNPWSQVGSSQDFSCQNGNARITTTTSKPIEVRSLSLSPCGLHSPPFFVGSLNWKQPIITQPKADSAPWSKGTSCGIPGLATAMEVPLARDWEIPIRPPRWISGSRVAINSINIAVFAGFSFI